MPVDFIEEVEPTSIDFVEELPAPTLRGPSEPSTRSTISGGPPVQTMPFTESIQEPVETVTRMVASTEPAIPFTKLIPSPETPTTLAERGLAMAIPGGAVASALYGPEVPVAGLRSLARGVLSVPEFLTSPLGVSTAGVASLGKVAQTLVSLGFSVDMAKSLYQQGASTIKGWGTMTPAEKTDALVSMAQTAGFAGAAGVHGVKGAVGLLPKRPVEPTAVPPVIPPPIPKTPPPLPRLAETPDVETALRQPESAEALTEIDKEIARAKQISPAARGPQITEASAEPSLQPAPEVAAGEKIVAPETTIPEPPKEMFHGTRTAGTLKIGQGKNLNTQGLWLSDYESKASEFSEGRPSDEGIASVRSVEFTPSKTKKVYGPDLKHTDANDLIKQGYDSVYVPDTGFWIALKESAFKEKQPTQPKAEYAFSKPSPNALPVESAPRSSKTMGEGIPPERKEPSRTQAETGSKTEAPVAKPDAWAVFQKDEPVGTFKNKAQAELYANNIEGGEVREVRLSEVSPSEISEATIVPGKPIIVPKPEPTIDVRDLVAKAGALAKRKGLSSMDRSALGVGIEEARQGKPEMLQHAVKRISESLPKEPRKVKGAQVQRLFDRETEAIGTDILDWIADNMPMMSKTAAKKSMGENFKRNASDWDDAPRLPVHHNERIYKGSSTPNKVAQAAFDAGKIEDSHVRTLWAAIETASQRRLKVLKRQATDIAKMEVAADFEETAKSPTEGKQVKPVDQLKIGDAFKIDGTDIEVIDVDPEGVVTLKDGSRWGIQQVKDGETLFVEQFEPVEKPSTVPKLGAMEKGTGDLLKNMPEDFALVQEKGIDQERIDAAKAKKAKDIAESQKGQTEFGAEPPKPIGMGGAVPEEFQRVGGSPAATKFRMMDQARVSRGLEPLLKPESVKDQAVLDRAMAEYDNNPAGAEKLADSLIENPRPIQDWENDYLLLRWIDTRDQFYKSAKEAQIADADGRVADLAAANGRTAEWSAAMTKLEKALRIGGSETGRALRARRVLIAEDFTLAGLETQRRAQLQSVGVSGAELERQMAEGRAELERMASEYKATADSLKIDLENRNQRISRLEAKLELNRIKAEAAKQPYDKRVLDYAESIVKRMETAADAASIRLKERLARMSAGVDPLILSDAAIVGAAKIARLGLNLAKFTDVMVAEYSEKMRPFMAEIWDASNKLLEANLKPENKKVKTAIKRNATITERKVDAETKIRTKIQEGKRNELTPVLRRYERILVEQGMDKLDPIVDEVHKFVQQIDPTMTRDMTMDALSGYGDFKPLSKNTVDVVVRDLHQQGQLVAKLRDMASGVSPSRSGFERQPPSDIARWLTKQVEEAKKKGGYQVTNPAMQLRTAMDAVHKRFQDQIADLEHQISTRQKIVRDKTALVYDEKANQLKARRDELKEIFDEVFPKEPLTDAQRIERWNRQIDRRIADYEERIINRDFSKREKRPPPPLGPNELAKMDRLLQLKEGFNDLLLHDRYKNMKLHQKAWVAAKESLNIPRNVMASADLSAVLRQGGILAGSHPILAAKGIVPMLKGFASERLAGISDQEIMNRPNAKSGRYAQAKLYMAPLRSTTLSAMEEQIMSRFVHSKLFKWTGVRASNRAFITFLNRIRADSFDLMVENLERKGTPLTDAELKAIGNYINIATGRGDMGRFAAGSEALATAFFAPRLVTSRFQFLAGQPFMRGTAQTRTLIAKEYARSLAALSVVLSLGALAGATVETDPRSSDFGKMRFGNVRLDPMAGLSQTAVLLSRIFSGKQKQMSGKLVPLRGPEVKYGMGNTADVLFRFLRAKFSPVVGTALNIASGENVVGEPVTAVNEIKNLLTPLSFQEVLNVMKEQGMATGTAMTILSLFGMGLQYFEPKKSKASNAALIP